jgi:hypothetical protein
MVGVGSLEHGHEGALSLLTITLETYRRSQDRGLPRRFHTWEV